MRVTEFALSATLGIALLTCATPPTPEDSSSSGLALHLNARAPVTIFPAVVDHVLFVKVDGSEDDSILRSSIFYSNYSDDGYFYLLNPPPGRYVAVAAVGTKDKPPSSKPAKTMDLDGLEVELPDRDTLPRKSFNTSIYFNEEFVRQTEVTARPGSFAFMGEFLVHASTFEGADGVQSHYFRLLQPGESSNVLAPGRVHDSAVYSGRIENAQQDEGARERFSRKAAEHLTSAGWEDILRGVREGSGP